MTTVTIPRKLPKKGDLVVIPKKEYEEFLSFRKTFRIARPTKGEMRAIQQGRREFQQGKFITLGKLKNELARRSR